MCQEEESSCINLQVIVFRMCISTFNHSGKGQLYLQLQKWNKRSLGSMYSKGLISFICGGVISIYGKTGLIIWTMQYEKSTFYSFHATKVSRYYFLGVETGILPFWLRSSS